MSSLFRTRSARPTVVQSATGTVRTAFGDEKQPKSLGFVLAMALGQLGLFIALFSPIMIGMAVKAGTLAQGSDLELATIVGNVLGFGAIGAFLGNSVFGRVSDRSRSRFGMRRTYMVVGVLVMAASFFAVSVATDVVGLTIAWFFAQLGANAAYAPFTASLADQLPEKQFGRVSALLGIMQNVAIFLATWIASSLSSNILIMFMVPAIIGVVAILVYCFVLPDTVQHEKPEPMRLGVALRTFWVDPIKNPDFGLAWWSRFLVIAANMFFITFRLPYVIDRLDVAAADAPGVVTQGVLWYTITVVTSGYLAGWLSDRIGRRKVFVVVSSVIFALGTYLLLHIETVEQFFLVEALIGVGYGIYLAIDLALVLQILPNPNERGKDIAVFNIANAVPSSLAPFIGGALLAAGGLAGAANYDALLTVAALAALGGAVLILPIRKVR